VIPVSEKTGFPTISATQLRTYGAGGFALDEQEETKGCPRQWKAKYVDRVVDDGPRSYPLQYGSFIHEVFYAMEQDGLSPEEAVEAKFPVDGDPKMIQEALDDLRGYMERGSTPSDRFATIGVELDLAAELYVDEEYGPIWWRGILDWVGIDPEDPGIVHVVDYKSNRFPPTIEAVRGDVQMKSYAWLIKQNAERLGLPPNVRVVVHLDAIKWREVVVWFTDDDIDEWHTWAVAVTRTIVRDEECAPVINPGCSWCPVADTCPAMEALPKIGEEMLGAVPDGDWDARMRWRDQANRVRLLLEKRVKAIDEARDEEVHRNGELIANGYRWFLEAAWKTKVDARRLHRVLGDVFYEIVTVPKTKVDGLVRGWDAGELAMVDEAFERVAEGVKVAKQKVEKVEE
jgi:hypothetical protein